MMQPPSCRRSSPLPTSLPAHLALSSMVRQFLHCPRLIPSTPLLFLKNWYLPMPLPLEMLATTSPSRLPTLCLFLICYHLLSLLYLVPSSPSRSPLVVAASPTPRYHKSPSLTRSRTRFCPFLTSARSQVQRSTLTGSSRRAAHYDASSGHRCTSSSPRSRRLRYRLRQARRITLLPSHLTQ